MTIGVPEVTVNNWYFGITKKEKKESNLERFEKLPVVESKQKK